MQRAQQAPRFAVGGCGGLGGVRARVSGADLADGCKPQVRGQAAAEAASEMHYGNTTVRAA